MMNSILAKLTLICLLFCSSALVAEELPVLTLDEAIYTALENNPGVTLSQAGVEIRRAGVKNAKSVWYPEINTRFIVPFVGRESGFFLDQLIWDFGRTSNRIKSSKAQLKSSRFEKEATEDDIILDTQIAYFTVLSKKHLSEALEKRVIEYEQRLLQSQGFLRSGRVPPIDVTRAEVNLGNAKLEAITAQNELANAKVNLLSIMGVEGEFNFELEDYTDYEKEVFELEAIIDRALASKPELKSLQAKKDAMRANLKVTKGEFYPQIFGRTAYRFKGEGATTPGFIAGVGLRFPIFVGFSRFADMESARGSLKQAKAEIVQERTAVTSEIKRLYLDLGFAEENIMVTQKSKVSAQKSLELARERYRLRRASNVELAEAESLYATTNATFMQSIYNYRIAAARLKNAIGENEYTQE